MLGDRLHAIHAKVIAEKRGGVGRRRRFTDHFLCDVKEALCREEDGVRGEKDLFHPGKDLLKAKEQGL